MIDAISAVPGLKARRRLRAIPEHALLAAWTLAAAAVVAAAVGGVSLVSTGSGARPVHAAPPSDLQRAQRAVNRYFTAMNEGDGLAFCGTAVSAAVRESEGGIYHCVAKMDGYVAGIRKRALPAAVFDLQALFSMVSNGITTHCGLAGSCPVDRFALWATEFAGPGVTWRMGTDPRLASSVGSDVVAVVDPALSSAKWITLYYQAPDGQILRASWSTAPGSWRGSVVDTHAGRPLLSDVHVLAARAMRDGSIDATVSLRVGTAPTVEQFRLVVQNGMLRADSWVDVTATLTA